MAVLGATVGVAIYDETAGVGGIIHLLLPEPTGATVDWNPQIYASSGIPFFIEKLLEAGGDRGRLKAVVASGSLFDSKGKENTHNFLNWRTTEVAEDVLDKAGIPFIKLGTGGDFSSTLQLNTQTWQAKIESITVSGKPAAALEIKGPSAVEIENAIAQAKPLPEIALKTIRLLQDPDYHMFEVAEEIRRDQVIVAKVLRYTNSVLTGTRTKIDSIDRALLFLGERNLFEIVVSAAIDSFFSDKPSGYELVRGGFYKHAFATAHVAKEIAKLTDLVDPGTAYTAGLLHDIGKVVLDNFVAGFLPSFYRSSRDEHDDFIELEKELFGVDHQETGKRLAEKWNLPETLTEVIACHHVPEKAVTNKKLVIITYVADLLTSGFMAGLELERINLKLMEKRLGQIDLSSSHLPTIVDKIPWQKLISM